MALWRKRAHDIVRVYITEETLPDFKDLLAWCAKERKAYHVVGAEELSSVTKSVHHQGICILADERAPRSLHDVICAQNDPASLIFLDGVANPHNVGSILRVAAHFGVKALIGEDEMMPKLSASMARVAEGGAEEVELVHVENGTKAIRELKELAYRAVGATQRDGRSLYTYRCHPHSVIILGAEARGLSTALRRLIDDMITIPGSGLVESLNVATACGVILGEFWRQQQGGGGC